MQATWAIASNKAQKVMNHVFDTTSKMESPQKTTRGKDIVRIGTGISKGEDKVTKTKYEVGMTVAFNSDKGIVLGLEASGEVANVKGEILVKGHGTTMNDNGGVEVKAELQQKSGVPKPTEEISTGNGVIVAVNPKETGNLFSDLKDNVTKYVKAELQKINDVRKGNHEKK